MKKQLFTLCALLVFIAATASANHIDGPATKVGKKVSGYVKKIVGTKGKAEQPKRGKHYHAPRKNSVRPS